MASNAPLPPAPDLAVEFNVSRMTVRHAYQRLVSAGAVVRYCGLGSFVPGHVFEELPLQGIPNGDRRINPPFLRAPG